MGACFALGSTCFFVGPFPGYVQLVGARAGALTFFVGSLLFTAGGLFQSWLAIPGRAFGAAGRAAWHAAGIQTIGTVCFNVTTFQALQTAIGSQSYDRLVWRPDAIGSVCFLVSGVIAFRGADGHGLRRPWQPTVNLLGCVFFGLSAVAGYVVPSSGSVLALAAANWNTCLGAACFFACAVASLRSPMTSEEPGGLDGHDVRQPELPLRGL
jgi:hypothetical protein